MIRTGKANDCKNEIIKNIDVLFAEYGADSEPLRNDILEAVAKAFEKYYK